MENLRRIITGHNEDGKSIISIDGPPARTLGEDVGGLFEIWNTDGEQINSLDNKDRADIDVILSPPKMGQSFDTLLSNQHLKVYQEKNWKKLHLGHSN